MAPAHFSSPSSLSSRLSVMHSAKQLDRLWKNREMGERAKRADNDARLPPSGEGTVARRHRLLRPRPASTNCAILPPLLVYAACCFGCFGAPCFEPSTRRRRKEEEEEIAMLFSPHHLSLLRVFSSIFCYAYTHPARRSFVCGCVHNVGLPSLQIGHARRKWGWREGKRLL